MICKNCGGEIPDGSKVCSFCEQEVRAERSAAEYFRCGCSDLHEDAPQPSWWKEEEDCAHCGGGLTSTEKDGKYVLFLFGLIAGVLVMALLFSKLFA